MRIQATMFVHLTGGEWLTAKDRGFCVMQIVYSREGYWMDVTFLHPPQTQILQLCDLSGLESG